MYQSLNNFYFQVAETDSKIYQPPSLPIEKNIYDDYRMGHPEIPSPILSNKSCTFLPNMDNFAKYTGSVPYVSRESYKELLPPKRTPLPAVRAPLPPAQDHPPSPPSPKESSKLLPVLNPVFNLREICKQSILLEDHLTHDEKRCTDCCIKHFLALEGLCEEAITLDKEKVHLEKIEKLPKYIREVAKKWYDNPTNNSLECAQMLRKMRKDFQEDSFNIIFDTFCDSNVCRPKN